MKYIIPESLKPSDVDLNAVTTPEECFRLLLWLGEVTRDMAQQIKDRGEHDQHWVLKLRAAQRATNNLVHRAAEKRDNLIGDAPDFMTAIYEAVLSGVPDEVRAAVVDAAIAKHPHLESFRGAYQNQLT